jgi:hypothetical protein
MPPIEESRSQPGTVRKRTRDRGQGSAAPVQCPLSGPKSGAPTARQVPTTAAQLLADAFDFDRPAHVNNVTWTAKTWNHVVLFGLSSAIEALELRFDNGWPGS